MQLNSDFVVWMCSHGYLFSLNFSRSNIVNLSNGLEVILCVTGKHFLNRSCVVTLSDVVPLVLPSPPKLTSAQDVMYRLSFLYILLSPFFPEFLPIRIFEVRESWDLIETVSIIVGVGIVRIHVTPLDSCYS